METEREDRPRLRGTKICYHMQLRGIHFENTLATFHLGWEYWLKIKNW